jgi:hypothetical protein
MFLASCLARKREAVPDFFWTRRKIRAPDNKTITTIATIKVILTTTTSLLEVKGVKSGEGSKNSLLLFETQHIHNHNWLG